MLNYNFYQYSVNINPLMFDDGHGDYNRSYEPAITTAVTSMTMTISTTPITPPTTATIITAILKRNAAKAKKKLLKIF